MVNAKSQISMQVLYDQDFNLWLAETVRFLKEGKLLEVDYGNLIEELETMGQSEKNALKSNLKILLMHLLKYQFQPEKRTNSWRYTITEHRQRILDSLEISPSLKGFFEQEFERCYQNARRLAADETGISIGNFPKISPFTISESLDLDYLP
ncbi:protein of unknown function DUF29 [Picosynechococcus sp. OG1]|nr:conserved hypothetical protein (DUF29) [Picosynechococcus sp. PCC 7002]SMH36325.1 protein of unknown function DUF29 [Picosynechococcus sp. OG1]SMQ77693.1 protein of unknown function DUF29 [Synechococcus sp. 7002]